MRQLIIARKDLNMSAGKLAAQVAHASMAFMSRQIQYVYETGAANPYKEINKFGIELLFEPKILEEWFCDVFTKTVCEAKNKNQLLKAKTIAEEMGMKEGIDFFLIKDACNTELKPEEFDENGVGRTLTCIGFKPLDDEIAWKISKKFQLYK